MPTLLIIDPHPVTRHGIIHTLVAATPNLQMTEASNFSEALQLLCALPPDAILSEFQIDGDTILTLLAQLEKNQQSASCLVYSAAHESRVGLTAIRAGAVGFLPKSAPLDDLSAAVHAVLNKRTWISSPLAKALATDPQALSAPSPRNLLSHREQEIFTLIGQGQTCTQIAAQLGLATKTVESHREHIKTKLHLKNASQVTATASRWLLESSLYEI